MDTEQIVLNQIIENMPGVIFKFIKTPEGQFRFTHISAKVSDLTGLSPTEFLKISDPLNKYIHPEDFEGLLTQLQTSASYSTTLEWQGRICLNSKIKWIHIKANPTADSLNLMYWDGLMMDITMQRFLMDQFLQHKSRLISEDKINSLNQMASGIAHEINTPLTTANLNFEIIKARITKLKTTDEVFEKCFQRFEQASQKISLVIDRLRQLSKNNFNVEQKTILDLNDVVLNCLNHVADYFWTQFNIKIDADLCADGLPIMADEGKIFQAIYNLISNSKDAVADQPNKIIQISTYSTPVYNYFKIKDNGVGITKDLLPKVFEPFYTTKHKNLNSGVGLSVSGSILTEHDAIIDISSSSIEENPFEHGTEITIKFPIADIESMGQDSKSKTA